MKILILDDDPKRLQQFAERTIGHEVTFTMDADSAIRALQETTYDFAMLDHDLQNKVFVTEVLGTGCEVCLFIENHPDRKPKNIVLHSLNADGRKRQKQACPDAIERPWVWMYLTPTMLEQGIEAINIPIIGV